MRSALFVVVFSVAVGAFANTPPDTPAIIEPSEARPIDPGDVHMATAPFSDADPSDHHLCSDWEIRTTDGHLIWYASCAAGVLAVHIHLGDGAFVNAEGHLLGSTQYVVRVRFRDDSGDEDSEWSDWATRAFLTGSPSAVRPMVIDDVLASPPPRLRDATGADVTLSGNAAVSLVSESGRLLLSFTANGTINPSAMDTHADVKVVVSGVPAISAPTIEFADDAGTRHTIDLPDLAGSAAFWIAQDGSSFAAAPGDAAPQFTTLARAAEVPWTALPGYRVERVVSGLQLPVNIAFVPSPSPAADAPLFYITELYGTIRAVLRDGTMRDYATGLLNFNPTGVFPGSGEHGIAGTAVDPESGDLFVAAVYEAPNSLHYPKVIRLHSSDGGRTASSATTVLDMAGEEIGPSHQISSVSFGPDGKLYVHVGDGFHTEVARDLVFFRGKILRLNRDGSAPADNPFYDPNDGITATNYIYARGFRNPFGGAWRAADASLYEVENGPAVDRLAKVSPGFDYAWHGSDDDMRVHAAYNWEQSVAPVNIAFVGDHAFVSESGPTWVGGTTPFGKRIREFTFDAGGNVASTRSFLEYAGTGYATAAALAAGPDGLYFSDLFPDHGIPTARDANVYRIRFIGSVSIAAEVAEESTNTVQFSPIITVPDYARILWDFGDGTTSTDAAPQHTFAGGGPYDVRLAVTDAHEQTVEDFTRVEFQPYHSGGLIAVYSDTEGNQVSRVDDAIDFNWSTDAPPLRTRTLDIVWTGEMVPAVSGLYTFALQTDGAGALFIDGRRVLDSDTSVPKELANPIRLEAGHHYAFVLRCEDTSMGGATQLSWTPLGMPAQVVPASAFYPGQARRRAVH